jgi:phosphoribosylformylglycinamidine synthase
MWQLVEAIEGIGEACRALNVPITGGNVSLYNETNGEAIYPTPILGVVGVIDDASKVVARAFRQDGDDVVLLGEGFGELGGSEYLKTLHQLVKGRPPALDLDRERRLIALLGRAAASGMLRSAHDCSDGGLAVTLAECAFDSGGIGCEVDIPEAAADAQSASAVRLASVLFGESASRAVVSVRPSERTALLQLANDLGVSAKLIGRTGGSRLVFRVAGELAVDLEVDEAERVWSTAIAGYFKSRAA